jgi:hypothetical protein
MLGCLTLLDQQLPFPLRTFPTHSLGMYQTPAQSFFIDAQRPPSQPDPCCPGPRQLAHWAWSTHASPSARFGPQVPPGAPNHPLHSLGQYQTFAKSFWVCPQRALQHATPPFSLKAET